MLIKLNSVPNKSSGSFFYQVVGHLSITLTFEKIKCTKFVAKHNDKNQVEHCYKIDKNWQELTRADKNWQELTRTGKNWQESKTHGLGLNVFQSCFYQSEKKKSISQTNTFLFDCFRQ